MGKIRAIYKYDVRFNNCSVFELQTIENKLKFVMLENNNFRYDLESIIEDDDWIVFEVILIDKNEKIEELVRNYDKEELKTLCNNKEENKNDRN